MIRALAIVAILLSGCSVTYTTTSDGGGPGGTLFTVGSPDAGVPFAFEVSAHREEHWAVDFEGDGVIDAEGDVLPETLTHVYTTQGEVVMRLVLQNTEGEVELTRSLTVRWLDDEVHEGTVLTTPAVASEGHRGCVRWVVGSGIDCAVIDIGRRTAWDYEVTAAGRGAVTFLDGCTPLARELRTDDSGDGVGDVPDHARCAVVWGPSGAMQTWGLRLVSPSNQLL